MMYMIFIIDHIHHLMNVSKMLIFAYNCDRGLYKLNINIRVVAVLFGILMTDGLKNLCARLEIVMFFMKKYDVCI
jgi:hypothetical protein